MRVPFRLVDVFAETAFSGNQLCVVSEPPEGLDTDAMLKLTREINFSETTFVTAIREGGYDVRIITPGGELPFAGHPTIGTAFVLHADGRVGSSMVQTSIAGDVPVDVDLEHGRARMRQLPPTFGAPVTDREAVARGAGLQATDLIDHLPVIAVSTGIPHLMVAVRDEETLRRAQRDDRACAAICEATDAESLYLFTVRGEGDVMARMFDRWLSIGEDPATGSAAGPLGAFMSAHELGGMPGRMTIAQGEIVGRPSVLSVEAAPADESWAVDVSGGVRIVGDGAFEV